MRRAPNVANSTPTRIDSPSDVVPGISRPRFLSRAKRPLPDREALAPPHRQGGCPPCRTQGQRRVVIACLSCQCSDRQLHEWLTRRKVAYFETTLTTWDSGLLTYAVARDAACWPLDRPEAEIWFLLEGSQPSQEPTAGTPGNQEGVHIYIFNWFDFGVCQICAARMAGGCPPNSATRSRLARNQ
jgi:hypothetical protein